MTPEEPAEKDTPSARDKNLDEVIALFLETLESGREPDREEFISRYPNLASELRSFFSDKDYLDILNLKLKPTQRLKNPIKSAPVDAPISFDDYELLEEISRGGMGVVYRAKQVSLHRIVALKTIRASQHAAPEEILRFQFEAKAAAGLEHPHIVPLYEVGKQGGVHFFSMKFIEGGNLATHLEYLLTDPRAAIQLMLSVARAVHHAHTRGILHRDLKPGNILIDRNGVPYVGDFGLAKSIEDDSSLTQSGAILGTPSYMAPEQAVGKRKAVTTASDIYSLGVILFELLTGRPPFQGETSVEILHKVVHDDPPRPSQLNPRVPRDLETIALKCLEKEPQARYATAREMVDDLERYLEGEPIQARPASTWERGMKWIRRRPALAGLIVVSVIALLILIGGGIWSNALLKEQARETWRYLNTARMNMAFDAWDHANSDRTSAFLKSLIPKYGQEDLRSFDWYLLWRLSHQHQYTLRVSSGQIRQAVFSPDSKRIATRDSNDSVILWESNTGKKIRTLKDHEGTLFAVAFSPRGKLFASANGDTVRIWDMASWQVRSTLSGHKDSISCLAFSPVQGILATASSDHTVILWNIDDGTERKTLKGHESRVGLVVFSGDGNLLATADEEGNIMLWDPNSGEYLSTWPDHRGPVNILAISGNSKFMAIGGADHVVILWDILSKTQIATYSKHKAPIWGLDFSPDSRILATSGEDRTTRLLEVPTLRDIRSFRGHGGPLSFSPDGSLLAARSQDGTARIWKLTGQSSPVVKNTYEKKVSLAAISRDGKTILAGRSDYKINRIDLDSGPEGNRVRVHSVLDLNFSGKTTEAISPDGRFLAAAGKDHVVKVWRLLWKEKPFRPVEEASLRDHRDTVLDLNFSADSRTLISSSKDKTVRLWDRVSTGDGASWSERACFEPGRDDIMDVALSPDGKILAMARHDEPEVILWDVPRNRPGIILREHSRWVVALAFSRDSKLFATGGLDNSARLWDLTARNESEMLLATFVGHADAVASLAFSPDGKILVSGSDDSTVKIWDLCTREERGTLEGHLGAVDGVFFSPDSRTLFTMGGKAGSGGGGEVRIWRAATDEEVAEWLREKSAQSRN